MGPEQFKFVELVKELNNPKLSQARALEIGSFDVYGEIRSIFSDATEYIGIDLCDGPGVDVVANAHDLDKLGLGQFDVVLSCEALEHDPDWQKTLKNALNCLKPGGMLIVTCATTLRPEHGTPRTSPSESPGTQSLGWSYYGNISKSELMATLNAHEVKLNFSIWTNPRLFDLYAIVSKTPPETDHHVYPTDSDIDALIRSTPFQYQLIRFPIRIVDKILGVRAAEFFGRHYWTFLAARFSRGIRGEE